MASNSDFFIKKTLGDDFFESLTKYELWKPGTRSTIDHEEIKTALQIVPRTVMSLLIHHLAPMDIGETKEIHLPISEMKVSTDAILRVTKHERDVFSGEIEQENKKVVDFKLRSIPGVGLVIMSAFELYDTGQLVEEKKEAPTEDVGRKVQQIIDERLALHDLIHRVVDKKLTERDAIKELMMAKITESLRKPDSAKIEEQIAIVEKSDTKAKKESPLKGFLDNRKSKQKTPEFNIEMAKNEHVDCPDCGNKIFDGTVFSGCICYGDDRNKKVHITKTEEGIKVRFGRGWDAENIEMLLEILRSKNE